MSIIYRKRSSSSCGYPSNSYSSIRCGWKLSFRSGSNSREGPNFNRFRGDVFTGNRFKFFDSNCSGSSNFTSLFFQSIHAVKSFPSQWYDSVLASVSCHFHCRNILSPFRIYMKDDCNPSNYLHLLCCKMVANMKKNIVHQLFTICVSYFWYGCSRTCCWELFCIINSGSITAKKDVLIMTWTCLLKHGLEINRFMKILKTLDYSLKDMNE